MSDIPTINTGGIGNIQTNTNQIPNIGISGPSIISAIDPPVVQSTPQPVIRGLELPVFQAPDTSIKYPVIRVPTQEEFDAAVRAERKKQEEEEEEEQKNRGLPDTIARIIPPQIQQVLPEQEKPESISIPPVNLGVPVIQVPIIGEVPIPPKEQVMLAGTTATASVAAALLGKSFVEWMVKRLKPILKQLYLRGKVLFKKDLTPYELQLFFAAELDKKNIKLLKKEWKKEKVSQYKKSHDK
jgi:hypothetical protein